MQDVSQKELYFYIVRPKTAQRCCCCSGYSVAHDVRNARAEKMPERPSSVCRFQTGGAPSSVDPVHRHQDCTMNPQAAAYAASKTICTGLSSRCTKAPATPARAYCSRFMACGKVNSFAKLWCVWPMRRFVANSTWLSIRLHPESRSCLSTKSAL